MLLTLAGIMMYKDVPTIVIIGLLAACCLMCVVINIKYSSWYIEIKEIPRSDFVEYTFKNMYVLSHRESMMAFEIPMTILDMIDLNKVVKIRHNYDYAKQLKNIELDLMDQERKT
jgi:hypothetical protein